MIGTIIAIGDELLIGQVLDTNSQWIASQCAAIGIDVRYKITVGDKQEDIINAIDRYQELSDILITTGGLGPTTDDMTLEAIGKALGVHLEFDEASFNRIENYFVSRNREFGSEQRKQCMLPAGSKALTNNLGTAPGMFYEKHGKIIVSFPGVPYEMKELFSSQLIPLLKERLKGFHIVQQTILTAGIGETDVAKIIAPFIIHMPTYISVAYLPGIGQVRIRLTGKGEDEKLLHTEIKKYIIQLEQALGIYVYGKGEENIITPIAHILNTQQWTLGLAESCTGGRIAAAIVNEPGVSSFFKGGIVSYDNDIKHSVLNVPLTILENFGAVSPEVVTAMADGALNLLQTDVAVAVSGVAGPEGGTEDKPVGLVWVCICSKIKPLKLFHFNFNRNRSLNLEFTTIKVLNELRLYLTD